MQEQTGKAIIYGMLSEEDRQQMRRDARMADMLPLLNDLTYYYLELKKRERNNR